MKRKFLVILISIIAVFCLCFSLTACAEGPQGPQGEKGETGAQGPQGEKGETGAPGAPGKSAYEIWLDNGYTGTEKDFLNWLRGDSINGGGEDNDASNDQTGDNNDDKEELGGESQGNEPAALGKYVLTLQSTSGTKLNDVRVIVKKDGVKQAESISINGSVEFRLPLYDYELEFDGLPKGCYLDPSVSYKTGATDGEITFYFLCGVIQQTATANISYKIGDVMYDFTFTDCGGDVYKLSDVLKTKKVAVIKFFYTSDIFCCREFPAIEFAYSQFSDEAEVLFVDIMDSLSTIVSYKQSNDLNFPMGAIDQNTASAFGVYSYPTTIVIDRYGVITDITVGMMPDNSFWEELFEKYTSDGYVQDLESEEEMFYGNI